MPKPRVIAQQWISVDGFASGDDDESPIFEALPPAADERSQDHNDALLADVERVLLGRRTYERFAQYWPTADERMAAHVNRIPKTVASTSLTSAPWGRHAPAETTDDPIALARRHRETGSGILLVWGSLEVMNALVAADALDELDLFVSPIALGSGRRLLDPGRAVRLHQLASEDWDGITHLRYEVSREPDTASRAARASS